jgi:hypothetical protein
VFVSEGEGRSDLLVQGNHFKRPSEGSSPATGKRLLTMIKDNHCPGGHYDISVSGEHRRIANQHRPEVYRIICVVRTAVRNSSATLVMIKAYRACVKGGKPGTTCQLGTYICWSPEIRTRGDSRPFSTSVRGCSRSSHEIPRAAHNSV